MTRAAQAATVPRTLPSPIDAPFAAPERTRAFGSREIATLASLLLLTFSLGVGEFVVMGLLPELAAEFAISIPAAGWIVTGYALGVAFGGPLIAVLTLRAESRRLLLVMGAVLIVATLACAFAPTYALLMAARVAASAIHGAFVGVAVVAATRIVPPEREGSAVAAVIGGFTVATVIGVPLGTWFGQAFGWRSVFVVVAAVAASGWLLLAILLRRRPDRHGREPDLRGELAALLRPGVAAALLTTALGFGGMFAAFTYVAPFLTDVTGLSPSAVPGVLLLFGSGALVGNLLGGRFADRALMPTLLVLLGVLLATLVLLPLAGGATVAAATLLFVMGGAAFGATPGLQLRVVREAGDAPFLSSTLNVSAFNIGNALGAFGGGLVIASQGSARNAAWVGAAMVAAAILVTALAWRADLGRGAS